MPLTTHLLTTTTTPPVCLWPILPSLTPKAGNTIYTRYSLSQYRQLINADVHQVYSAYIEYFQVHNIPWCVQSGKQCCIELCKLVLVTLFVICRVQVRSNVGTPLYVLRGLSCLLMGYNHSNGCTYWSSSHCDEAQLDQCISEDDKNKVCDLR